MWSNVGKATHHIWGSDLHEVQGLIADAVAQLITTNSVKQNHGASRHLDHKKLVSDTPKSIIRHESRSKHGTRLHAKHHRVQKARDAVEHVKQKHHSSYHNAQHSDPASKRYSTGNTSEHSSEVRPKHDGKQKERRMVHNLKYELHSLDRGVKLMAQMLEIMHTLSELIGVKGTTVEHVVEDLKSIHQRKRKTKLPDSDNTTKVLRMDNLHIGRLKRDMDVALNLFSTWWTRFDRHCNHTSNTQGPVLQHRTSSLVD